MTVIMEPIGYVRSNVEKPPRHWTVSDVEGELVMDEQFRDGLKDILPGQRIIVLFHFDRSPAFTPAYLRQTPPHKGQESGVFSICSPIRPNPVGLSVVEVLETSGTVIRVKGLDMLDKTPILDIKPYIVPESAA